MWDFRFDRLGRYWGAVCGEELYCYVSFFISLLRPSGKPDFAVESTDTIWEAMFFPAPKRL